MTASASSKNAATPVPAPRWRRWAKRAALAGAGLLTLLTVVFFLLPVWISNEQGRKYLLERLNGALSDGGRGPRVEVDAWSLGWFRGTELKNLRILQPDGTVLLSSPKVSSGLTLWDLFWGNYDLRNTTAETLELRLVKFADGSTSLDSFGPAAGGILRKIRGAIRIDSAQVEVASAATGLAVRSGDLKASITIASPEAPFHVSVSSPSPAVGNAVSLTATFPPLGSLPAVPSWGGLEWLGRAEVSFAAENLPTALVCDCLRLDGQWRESLGDTLRLVAVNLTSAGEGRRIVLMVRGNEERRVDARVYVQLPEEGRAGVLTIPGVADYGVNAYLQMSPPLSRVMARLHPVLGELGAKSAEGRVAASVTSLSVPLEGADFSAATGAARLTFPPLVYVPRDRPSLMRQLQIISGDLPAGGAGGATEVEAEPLRVTLRDGRIGHENFVVMAGRTRITFSGMVGADGAVNGVAGIPSRTGGLTAGSSRVVITGTVEGPVVRRAE